MRVLYISDCYFPRVNGVATSIRNFRESLKEIGVDSTLVCPSYDDESFDTDIHRVPSRIAPFSSEDRMMRWKSLSNTLLYLQFESRKFDLVHVQTPFLAHHAGVRFAKRMRIPAIFTYHTHFEHYLHEYVRFLPRSCGRGLARALTRSQAKDVRAIVAPSHEAADVLRGYGIKTPVMVIPTGLSKEAFVFGNLRRFREKYRVSSPIMLYAGRVAREKNIPFLLVVLKFVMETIPNMTLVIAGDGPAREEIERAALEMGIMRNVRVLGYLDQATDLRDAYSAANVFVSASCTETQGLAALEARAQGIPAILLEDGTNDARSFAKRVVTKIFGSSVINRETALECSSERMAVKMRDLYQSLLT